MKMWLARTEDNTLCVFRDKPFYLRKPDSLQDLWVYERQYGSHKKWRYIGEEIDSNAFPEVTYENSPMEVELKLIEK